MFENTLDSEILFYNKLGKKSIIRTRNNYYIEWNRPKKINCKYYKYNMIILEDQECQNVFIYTYIPILKKFCLICDWNKVSNIKNVYMRNINKQYLAEILYMNETNSFDDLIIQNIVKSIISGVDII